MTKYESFSRYRQVSLQLTVFAALICLVTAVVTAQGIAPAVTASDDINLLRSHFNVSTAVVAHIDLKSLQLPDRLRQELGSKPQTQSILERLSVFHSLLSALSKERVTLMIDVPTSSVQPPLRMLARNSPEIQLEQVNQALAGFRFSPASVKDGYVTASSFAKQAAHNSAWLNDQGMLASHQFLQAAFKAMENQPIQIAVVPPAYLWRSFEELMPRLPAAFGEMETSTITQGVQWLAIGIDPGTQQIQVTIQSKSAEAAQRFAVALPRLTQVIANRITASGKAPSLPWPAPDKTTLSGDRIQLAFENLSTFSSMTENITRLMNLLLDPLQLRDKQRNLKELALSIHNYVGANKVLPPNQAGRQADGSSYLSWRVHVLPFIGEKKLYDEFHLNEPWDSEHNLPLLQKMPDVYAPGFTQLLPNNLPKGYTTIVAPVGEGTMFGGKKTVQFSQVEDGTSNTVMLVDVKPDRSVPWTAPLDYEFPVGDPASDLAVGPDGQFLCAFGDGSVRLLPIALPKEMFLRLFQMNDGKEIKF